MLDEVPSCADLRYLSRPPFLSVAAILLLRSDPGGTTPLCYCSLNLLWPPDGYVHLRRQVPLQAHHARTAGDGERGGGFCDVPLSSFLRPFVCSVSARITTSSSFFLLKNKNIGCLSRSLGTLTDDAREVLELADFGGLVPRAEFKKVIARGRFYNRAPSLPPATPLLIRPVPQTTIKFEKKTRSRRSPPRASTTRTQTSCPGARALPLATSTPAQVRDAWAGTCRLDMLGARIMICLSCRPLVFVFCAFLSLLQMVDRRTCFFRLASQANPGIDRAFGV